MCESDMQITLSRHIVDPANAKRLSDRARSDNPTLFSLIGKSIPLDDNDVYTALMRLFTLTKIRHQAIVKSLMKVIDEQPCGRDFAVALTNQFFQNTLHSLRITALTRENIDTPAFMAQLTQRFAVLWQDADFKRQLQRDLKAFILASPPLFVSFYDVNRETLRRGMEREHFENFSRLIEAGRKTLRKKQEMAEAVG